MWAKHHRMCAASACRTRSARDSYRQGGNTVQPGVDIRGHAGQSSLQWPAL